MFSKKRWNIYSFSKDTVRGFSSTTALFFVFLEAGKIGNSKSSENTEASGREEMVWGSQWESPQKEREQ